jgi:hypothetical protein
VVLMAAAEEEADKVEPVAVMAVEAAVEVFP